VVKSDWSQLENAYTDTKEDLAKLVADLIIPPVLATIRRDIGPNKTKKKQGKKNQKTDNSPLANAAIHIMTYPEYQLC
jgi:hypothetical protein